MSNKVKGILYAVYYSVLMIVMFFLGKKTGRADAEAEILEKATKKDKELDEQN